MITRSAFSSLSAGATSETILANLMWRLLQFSRSWASLSVSTTNRAAHIDQSNVTRSLPIPNWHWHRAASTVLSSLPRNEEIATLDRVRLISEDGSDRGEMSGADAWRCAREGGRDIMTVSRPKSPDQTFVVRLVDLVAINEVQRRRAYSIRKKRKETELQNRKEGQLKQIRLTPATGEHDFALKMRKARDFLLAGYRVRTFMFFRRGQGKLEENAKLILVRVAHELAKYGSLLKGDAMTVTVDDLFPKPSPEEIALNVNGQQPKSKPLEVYLRPVRRHDRAKLKSEIEGDHTDEHSDSS